MKMIYGVLAAAVAAAAVPALAQDTVPFAGPYIGAEAGWGRVGGSRIDSDGFIYGGKAGYDVALGNVRLGPEAAITGSTQKTCRTVAPTAPAQRNCQRSDRDLYIGGRLGYVVSPSALLYAKLGYANARFSDRTDRAGANLPEDRFNRGGVRIGAGLEYAVSRNIYVSGEYRYSHYSHRDSFTGERGIHQNQLLTGVGFRF